ncbi:MAG: polysaccharide pyruvyl transferase family protein [Bacteroidia bacterium]|nr:polysaccharide pyruvyl transferase family protein [Bacteroidia bacterium]
MKIKKILGKIIPVVDGDSLKRHVSKKVLNSEQSESGVINIHRHDHTNVGDFYCAPYLYFKELQGRYLDIYGIRVKNRKIRSQWIDAVSNNNLIVGGGGLFNLKHFEIQMQLFESLAEQGKKIVIWGAGHNAINYSSFNANRQYNVDINAFGMAGTRDFSMNNEWVPCVSCMHEIFDRSYDSEHEVGIVFHKNTLRNKSLLKQLETYPSLSNRSNLQDMIDFIGRSEIVVTDSYHALYWSMLMGKKAIGIPTTSKFFDFKHQPLISSYNTFETDLSKAFSFDGLLEEYREKNRNFASRVFDYLNL